MPTINGSTISNHLLALLILCIVVEVALAPIFNWRPYLRRYEGSSYIHPLTFFVVFGLLWWYQIDIVGSLLTASHLAVDNVAIGELLTTLLVMVGSQGVLRVFNFFGLRNLSIRQAKMQGARD